MGVKSFFGKSGLRRSNLKSGKKGRKRETRQDKSEKRGKGFKRRTGSVVTGLFAVAAGLWVPVACVNYPDIEVPEGVSSVVIDTRDYESWVYFSFEKGEIVPEPADFTKDAGWDLAFHRWDIRTNGGESGSGQGGALMTQVPVLEYESLYKLLVQSTKNMIPDGKIKTYMKMPDMQSSAEGDQRVEVPASGELSRWMTVLMSTIPPSYKLEENVFFVRTASGRYAAVKFTNYMNDKAVKGFVNFDYIYPLD